MLILKIYSRLLVYCGADEDRSCFISVNLAFPFHINMSQVLQNM